MGTDLAFIAVEYRHSFALNVRFSLCVSVWCIYGHSLENKNEFCKAFEFFNHIK